jgi:Uncharacterized protein conserved in bacteria (DUF2188)
MPDITVHRHGDRWAIREGGAESPVKEFPTREAAEVAAREMAAGGAVRVEEDDPTGLDAVQDPESGEPVETGPDTITATEATERSRSPQSGL